MTASLDMTTTVTEPTIQHPDWCAGGWCEVGTRVSAADRISYAHGYHFSGCTPLRSSHGWDLVAGLYSESHTDGRPSVGDMGAGVALRIAASTDFQGVNRSNMWDKGETVLLEPEEAELLARRLLEAVAEARARLNLWP